MIRVETCPDGLLEINVESCIQRDDGNYHIDEEQNEGVMKVVNNHKLNHTRVIVNKKTLGKKVRQSKCEDARIGINSNIEDTSSHSRTNSNIEDVTQSENRQSVECCQAKIEDEFFHEEGYGSNISNEVYENVGDTKQNVDYLIRDVGNIGGNANIDGKKRKTSKSYICEICNKTISIAANFNRHKRKHEMEAMGFQCKVCKKTFTGWNSLKSHLLIHSDVKPYACKYCPKTFRQKNQVTVHTRIHTQERPFVCKYCNASFIQSSAHLAHVRVHEGIRLHHCTYCDKSFTEKGSLNRHTRIHTHERPHACDLCHKLFVDRTGMLRHRRSHTKDRPYGCTICPKRFTRKENIRRHIGTAHKDVQIVVRKPPLVKISPELLMQSRNSTNVGEISSQK